MFQLKKSLAVSALLVASVSAQASALYSVAGFDSGDSTVTFGEVSLSAGTAVTNQFSSGPGVTFSTGGPGSWYAAGNSGPYRSNPNFSGNYLDSFSGGTRASTYKISFSNTVDAAGAYFEFNTSSPAATFSAYLNNVWVESFNYNNASCCSSTEFIGFAGINFNEIRITNITGTDFIMDNLRFSPKMVPEPGMLALFSLGLGGAFLSRRRQRA